MNTPSFVLVSRVRMTDYGGKWSFTIHSCDGGDPFEADDFEPGATRERLELLAIVRGLEALEQPSHVALCCESPHVFRRIAQGLDEWREAGWMWEAFGEMKPVANADLWRRIDRAIGIHKVECRRTPPAFRQPLRREIPAPISAEPVTASVEVRRHDAATEDRWSKIPVVHRRLAATA